MLSFVFHQIKLIWLTICMQAGGLSLSTFLKAAAAAASIMSCNDPDDSHAIWAEVVVQFSNAWQGVGLHNVKLQPVM